MGTDIKVGNKPLPPVLIFVINVLTYAKASFAFFWAKTKLHCDNCTQQSIALGMSIKQQDITQHLVAHPKIVIYCRQYKPRYFKVS